VNGKEQIQGVHYEETYEPVVGWATIRFFITLAIINKWHTKQLDFVLAVRIYYIYYPLRSNAADGQRTADS
jgi:hypothetical protein